LFYVRLPQTTVRRERRPERKNGDTKRLCLISWEILSLGSLQFHGLLLINIEGLSGSTACGA